MTHYHSEASAILRLKAALDIVGSTQAFADVAGVSRQFVEQVRDGKKGMSKRLALAIGLEQRTVYVTVNGKGRVTK